MKWLGRPSPFHLFTNPCVINRFIFGQGVVIYYILELLHDVEAIHILCKLLTAFEFYFLKYDKCMQLQIAFSRASLIFRKILRCA